VQAGEGKGRGGSPKTYALGEGVMETLKVVPTRKAVNFLTAVKGGSNFKVGSVINLMFEGNFLPLKVGTSFKISLK
jgi:hypothetical protein